MLQGISQLFLSWPVKLTAHISLWWPHEVAIFHAACFMYRMWDMFSRRNHFYCNSLKSLIAQRTCIGTSVLLRLPTTSSQSSHPSVWGGVTWSGCAVFSQPCGGRHRVSEAPQDGWETGRHWQWNAPCLQVRGPPTAPLLKQSWRGPWTSLTDGVKGMCEQHEHRTEYKVASCVDKAVMKYFLGVRTSRYCLWTLLMQTKRLMYEHTDMNQKKRGQTHLHVHAQGLWIELL